MQAETARLADAADVVQGHRFAGSLAVVTSLDFQQLVGIARAEANKARGHAAHAFSSRLARPIAWASTASR